MRKKTVLQYYQIICFLLFFSAGFDHSQSNIDLNVVRLCFQVFLPNEHGRVTKVVPPVCSHAIHDKSKLWVKLCVVIELVVRLSHQNQNWVKFWPHLKKMSLQLHDPFSQANDIFNFRHMGVVVFTKKDPPSFETPSIRIHV